MDEMAGANCGGAHRYFRLVSIPSCEGTVPVRLLSPRFLRERGWGGAGSRGRYRGGGCELRRRSQLLQLGKQPELRWDGAGQVVAVQVPARGQGHVGEMATQAEGGFHPHPCPGATARRCVGVPSCGGAHRYFRLVSSPSCGGTLPVRSL